MKPKIGLILFSAAVGLASANTSVDCISLSSAIRHAVSSDQSGVLDIVSKEVAASPDCACEIVKAAIEGSKADAKMVAAIVQVASTAAPERMRLISQCAVASAPDALIEIQRVIALLDPNLGEAASVDSAKGAKAPAGEVAADFNPLDFPGQGPVGPTPGGPGGSFLVPVIPPAAVLPPINVQRKVVDEQGPPQAPPVISPPPFVSPSNQPISAPPIETPPIERPPVFN
jgi:hypothetical protein